MYKFIGFKLFSADDGLYTGVEFRKKERLGKVIISTGVQTVRCLEACDLLVMDGIHPQLVHVPTIKPIDRDAIVEAASRTGAVVTAEDHSIIGGLGSAVAEILGEKRPTRMRRVGIQDLFGESAPNEQLLEKYGLTARHVAAAARESLMGDE